MNSMRSEMNGDSKKVKEQTGKIKDCVPHEDRAMEKNNE